MNSIHRFFLLLVTLQVCAPVSAELMGMVPGRGADVPRQAALSVEAGVSWYTSQLQWAATRVNFKPSQKVIAYIDLAKMRATDLPTTSVRRTNFAGVGYGGGIIFVIPDFLTAYDVAFKATYHAAAIDEAGLSVSGQSLIGANAANNQLPAKQVSPPIAQVLQQAQWSTELLFSPIDPLFENGLSWYSTLGFVSTAARSKAEVSALETTMAVEYKQKNGAALGMGLVKPIDTGRLYAGFEWLSGDPLVSVGFSHAFR